jgi:hypothetical protein
VTRAAATLIATAAALGAGCGGQTASSGAGEPIQVKTATFKAGVLPGVVVAPGDPAPGGPAVTAILSLSPLATAGQSGKALAGRTSTDAAAIAIGFEGAGSGYWLQPVGLPDPVNNGELTFDMSVDLAPTVPTGLQNLRFVAIDAAGQAGAQVASELCIGGEIPDNYNACDPTLPPPAAVISLAWDSAADLDLEVVTPDGRVVDPKHPSTAGKGATSAQIAAGGAFDGDAQAGCRAQGRRRENLIWKQQAPASGTYLLRVNMFDACGATAAHFTLGVYTPEPTGDATSALVVRQELTGLLLGQQANGGAAPGLYVGAHDF